MLIDLLRLTYLSGFKDKESFGLREASQNALITLSQKDFYQVYESLKAVKTEEQSDINTEISDLLAIIRDSYKSQIDIPMSFEDALVLVL